MSRFVKAVPFGLTAKSAAAGDENTPAKEYLERISKYIPGEIIASYTALNAMLATVTVNIQFVSFVIAFCLCWFLTPVYFALMATQADKPSLRKQQIVYFIAFAIWAYAIDGDKGVFGKLGFCIYQQGLGGAFLIAFSLISGAIIPRTGAAIPKTTP